jgi:hypothetical protein
VKGCESSSWQRFVKGCKCYSCLYFVFFSSCIS